MEGVDRSIAALGAAARELKHAEFEWHHQRATVVHRMNRGEFGGAKAALQALQDRAERLQLFSLQGVRAVDWGVLLRETGVRPSCRTSTRSSSKSLIVRTSGLERSAPWWSLGRRKGQGRLAGLASREPRTIAARS